MIPIKPGTARRLGICPPEPRPTGIFEFNGSMSEQELEAFAAALREAGRRSARMLLSPEPVEFTRRYLA